MVDSLEALERLRCAIFDESPPSARYASNANTEVVSDAGQQQLNFADELGPSQTLTQQFDGGSPNTPDGAYSSGVQRPAEELEGDGASSTSSGFQSVNDGNGASSSALQAGTGDARQPAWPGPPATVDGLRSGAAVEESLEQPSMARAASGGLRRGAGEGNGAADVLAAQRGLSGEGGVEEGAGPLGGPAEGREGEPGDEPTAAAAWRVGEPGDEPTGLAAGREGVSAGEPTGAAAWRVVGLDCEWEPCTRSGNMTPVSLLQVATRQRAFLIDMLWFCRPACYAPYVEERTGTGDPPETLEDGQNGSVAGTRVLTEREMALSAFLSDLFAAEGVVKLGFGLANDMERLCESYPQLPCFGGPSGKGDGEVSSSIMDCRQKRCLQPVSVATYCGWTTVTELRTRVCQILLLL
jgi:hypothetical protein